MQNFKKMKKRNTLHKLASRIFFVSVLLGYTLSCEKLPSDVEGQLSGEGFYTSMADIESGTLGVYSSLGDKLLANSENYCSLWAADDRTAATGSNKTDYLQFDQLQPLSTNGWQANGWNQLWTIVGAANTFMDEEPTMREIVAGNATNEAILNRSIAEVLFLRAFAYFEIVRTWGEVPLVTSQASVTGDETLASFEDLYGQIIEDLKYAKNGLGTESANGVYRVNKWSAQALLANVYLTSAGFPLKKTENYQLAAAEAKEIMDSGRFALAETFGGIMGNEENNLNQNGNKEAIIAFPSNNETGGWAGGNYQAYSILFGDKWVEVAFHDNFPEGLRKDFTFSTSETGQVLYSYDKFGAAMSGNLKLDVNYLRYAELLLIYAEAQIRATGNNADPDALDALNAVRNRAGLDDVASATWEDVVWEKAWETAGEWSRWYDIIRTETLDEVKAMRSPIDNALTPQGNVLTEANPWAPIPENDVIANPNLRK